MSKTTQLKLSGEVKETRRFRAQVLCREMVFPHAGYQKKP